IRSVAQRLQPGIIAGHRPGRLGPGGRQAARGQAVRRRLDDDAGVYPHRLGPRRPHPAQADPGRYGAKPGPGTRGTATGMNRCRPSWYGLGWAARLRYHQKSSATQSTKMPASVAIDAGSWMRVVNKNVTRTAPAATIASHRIRGLAPVSLRTRR